MKYNAFFKIPIVLYLKKILHLSIRYKSHAISKLFSWKKKLNVEKCDFKLTFEYTGCVFTYVCTVHVCTFVEFSIFQIIITHSLK